MNANEEKVFQYLKEKNIDYEYIAHKAVDTIFECYELEEIEEDVFYYKNLFLSNRQKTEFYLLILEGSKKFVTKDISKQIDKPRLSFADEDCLKEKLGVLAGHLSPFAFIKNKEKDIRLLIDKDLLNGERMAFHTNHNAASIILSKENFLKYLDTLEIEVDYIEA